MPGTIDITSVRSHFPSLKGTGLGPPPVFLDNPAGTQVPQEVIDAVRDYYLQHNANHGGAFATSIRSDALIHEARSAVADFLGASSPNEIVFGANMTTLTFHLGRSLAKTIRPGDEIIVTRLDHDANIAPWLALQELGAVVRWVDIHEEDCTLDMETFEAALSDRTRIVAVGYASNAVGTINDVRTLIQKAHAVGALAFIDAVHYSPHGPIDVQDLDCDFLAASVYKFFGPHIGVLYGKYPLLERLPAYKVRPSDNLPPGKWETGTLNHECIAGTLGTFRYLEWLGDQILDRQSPGGVPSRKVRLRASMEGIRRHERLLSSALLEGLQSVEGVRVWGITDRGRLDGRVPTVSFTMSGLTSRSIAEFLAGHGIYVWDGNYYALAIMERLGLEATGGMVRVGAVHYNTPEEIAWLVKALGSLDSQ